MADHLITLPAEIYSALLNAAQESGVTPADWIATKLPTTPKKQRHHAETTTEEWLCAFHEWVESHRGLDLPHLSDEDISRESIYGERI